DQRDLHSFPTRRSSDLEPIQGEGGDRQASPAFYRGLQEITKKYDICFIVDEVQTGVCATGTFWAHEQWNLPNPPDIVTFSKKMRSEEHTSELQSRENLV